MALQDNLNPRKIGGEAKGLLGEFRDFILRGNVVDLAVGIVIGAAFTSVVTAFVKDIITPLIPTGGNSTLSTFHAGPFLIGDFINAVISFLIVAAVVFFFVVKPVNAPSA
jgi:large conductance mechanosensitive channel